MVNLNAFFLKKNNFECQCNKHSILNSMNVNYMNYLLND